MDEMQRESEKTDNDYLEFCLYQFADAVSYGDILEKLEMSQISRGENNNGDDNSHLENYI